MPVVEELAATVDRLAGAWRRHVGTASRQALFALLTAVLIAGAHLARLGTPVARAAVAAALGICVILLVVRFVRQRRDYRSLRRTFRRVLVPTDAALGQRALRALALVERTEIDTSAGSRDLARLHLERLVARASLSAVNASAQRRAARFRAAALGLLGLALVAFAVGPMRVLEGLDVLFARGGRAPLPLVWLDGINVSSQPPSYLRSSDRSILPGIGSEQPEGSLLTVRGVPRREGRKLVLTDGRREVPFVGDGSGGVVARWTLSSDVALRVAGRFGEVLIEEPDALEVRALADEPPVVEVDGAPMTVKLADLDRLEIRYVASDDHGLRQIDLVLRSGGREERRVLGRLDGDQYEQGGHALSSRDPFLRRMFLPVVVTIEARDSDPFGGPKWGASEAITVVPPTVGEPEASRLAALEASRSALVDSLAQHYDKTELKTPAERRARSAERKRATSTAANAMRAAADGVYGGLAVPSGLRAFLMGQMRLLERPLRPGESFERRLEDVTLAVDVALRGLSQRDAEGVAKRLGDVAEEVALGARQSRETEQRSAGSARLDAALDALVQGVQELVRLGALGRDVGSVAQADLGRIKGSRQRGNLQHTELASLHLADRLRRPVPSFGSAQSGSVESGMPGRGLPQGEPSEANDRFDQLAKELEQLAQEHAGEIGRVEQSLAEAEQSVDLEKLRDEARERANAIRRAVDGLPQVGSDPGSGRAAAALGREHGQAMAQGLERLELGDAVSSGEDALQALEEALRKAREPQRAADWLDQSKLESAKRRIEQELAWARERLEELKRSAEARARKTLERSGTRESQLAERAGNLAGRGDQGETTLPRDAIDALEQAESVMRDAARRLGEGKGEEGAALQREAQRLLERASTGQTTDGDDRAPPPPRNGDKGQGGEVNTGGDVPRADDGRAAEDFRKRVLKGLGKEPGGRLSPAVKRYAEGLLQ